MGTVVDNHAVKSASDRACVLGGMGTVYQRQESLEESPHTECKRHNGSLPPVGVHTFLLQQPVVDICTEIEQSLVTPEEGRQIDDVAGHWCGSNEPVERCSRLQKKTAGEWRNLGPFMNAPKAYLLWRVTHALNKSCCEYGRDM